MSGFLQCMTMKNRDPWLEVLKNRRNAPYDGVGKIFVIFGNQNSGKTHTAWLVYNLLKSRSNCDGLFETHEEQKVLTYEEVLHHIIETFNNPSTPAISDFRAIIEINKERVAIFSAGDYVEDPNWDVTSFVKNIEWAEGNGVKYVVCTARHYNKTNSVHKYLKEHYNQKIYKWYYKSASGLLDERLGDAENVAKQVVADVIKE